MRRVLVLLSCNCGHLSSVSMFVTELVLWNLSIASVSGRSALDHAYVVIHFCESMWSFWEEANMCRIFYRLFIYVLRLRPWSVIATHVYRYQEVMVGIPLTDLAMQPQFWVYLKPELVIHLCPPFLLWSVNKGKRLLFVLLILVGDFHSLNESREY
jgi:hypothetical protein